MTEQAVIEFIGIIGASVVAGGTAWIFVRWLLWDLLEVQR